MMYQVGVFPGIFSPPHRGHITEILRASTQCEKLYVVISHNEKRNSALYAGTPTKPISFKQKLKWMSIELSEFDHIKVVGLDESDIPMYPHGWAQWAPLLKEAVNEPFDVIFGGEPFPAGEGYEKYFPGVKYALYDRALSEYEINATKIREKPYEHWDYILGASREHFVKRILIAGTESCGKTTLTKMLAKIFHTSWAREEGRYYSAKYFGGNEDVFGPDDFFKICWEQREIDDHAIRTANRIVFLDTDAVITQFYCKIYLGAENPKIETLIDPSRYDLVFFLKPDVRWVADEVRCNKEEALRWKLHEELLDMYRQRGFGEKIVEISGSYHERLTEAIKHSEKLLGSPLGLGKHT